MEKIAKKYQDRLDALAEEIQSSEHLEAFLNAEEEEEEYAHYSQLQQVYENKIHELYMEIADDHPLQLIDLEIKLLDEKLEGLYLPRILAYAVLRGVVDSNFKYIKPQDHLRLVFLALSHSSNFELLTKRIGQSMQVGFGLSSEIWVTNLINEIGNKRVRNFYTAQRILRYRDASEREKGLQSMRRQFHGVNFYTAEFPETEVELKTLYPELKEFLLQRIILQKENKSLYKPITEFAGNKAFWNHIEFIYIFGLVINYFDLDKKTHDALAGTLNDCRKKVDGFVDQYFEFLKELLDSKRLTIKTDCDQRVSELIDRKIDDQFKAYYNLMDTIRSNGYDSEDTLAAVQKFYFMNEGLSTINECLRLTLFAYFNKVISSLEAEEYPQYMELCKVISQYINVFNNQEFNQRVGDASLKYLKKLIKHYTDKRSKEYQDIKKFTTAKFLDWKYMREKDIANLFKSRRKKKVKPEE